MIRIIIIVFISNIWVLNIEAQTELEQELPIIPTSSNNKVDLEIDLSFKTMNIFRGLLPSGAPTISNQVNLVYKNWAVGVYGGVGFDGYYKETDFILAYRQPRFNVRLEYYYNYTTGITDIPIPSGIFDFNKQTTRGFLDFIVDVKLDKAEKWRLTSATIIFGRDTYLETITDGDDTYTQRTDQRYSQYFELERTWKWDDHKVQAHIGGSFSWNDPTGSQFYGKNAGINNIGLSYAREVKVSEQINLPVKFSTYINPLAQTSHVVFTVNLLKL